MSRRSFVQFLCINFLKLISLCLTFFDITCVFNLNQIILSTMINRLIDNKSAREGFFFLMNFWSKYNQTTTRFNYLFKVSWIWRKKKYDTRNKVSDQYWPLCKIIYKVVYLLNFLLFSCVHLLLLCHVYVKLGIFYLNSNRARIETAIVLRCFARIGFKNPAGLINRELISYVSRRGLI